MSEPLWLTPAMAIDAHAEQLALFGGPGGIRDQGMLESALDWPRNKFADGDNDLASLAAAYAYGVARNHPFVDGNKRSAFTAMIMFLAINEIDFIVNEAEATVMMLGLAVGEIGEEGLSRWIRDNWPKD
ncbi:MAG: type II toxin-antitoxin system death-on-curing family toxin [Alphaproteobacteria bacterium]|nr:type II toxin-antitoxin system death-on-curing family toxin [Alphaproteobacteria bacterium]